MTERDYFSILTTHSTLDKYCDVDTCNQNTLNKDYMVAVLMGHINHILWSLTRICKLIVFNYIKISNHLDF